MLEQNGGGSPVVSGGSAARNAPAGAGGVRGAGSRMPHRRRPRFGGGGARPQMAAPAPDPQAAAPVLRVTNFAELVALAGEKRDLQTKLALERDVRLVRFEDGKLEIALEPSAAKTLVNDLSRKFELWTGRPLDGGGLARAGPADAEIGGQAAKQEHARTAGPIRWSRRCWRVFPARRSSGSRKACPRARRNRY